MTNKIVIFWFRRDLRLKDNTGLYFALNCKLPVLPVFIFDPLILNKLSSNQDARVTFIYQTIAALKKDLETFGSTIEIIYDTPENAFEKLTGKYNILAVYTNNDYEPYAIERDKKVADLLLKKGVTFYSFKDHLIFEKDEVVKKDGQPYTVFTPFSRKWREMFDQTEIKHFESESLKNNYLKCQPAALPSLLSLGFKVSSIKEPILKIDDVMLENYSRNRDFPALEGTSRLGVHLRFGTISIREVVKKASGFSSVFLNELIWREFYSVILWHFPHVEKEAFNRKYNFIGWRNNENEFKSWCEGTTGYPLVDAGMRELNTTGYMHNRVRMVTASFLTKHLLIDWRWGEAYFAEKLLDFELASNNGGWQWAAGTGCDAAPYFRIFNPESQQQKFDKDARYILKWVPEYGTIAYPQTIVEHRFARERALAVYKKALKE